METILFIVVGIILLMAFSRYSEKAEEAGVELNLVDSLTSVGESVISEVHKAVDPKSARKIRDYHNKAKGK